MSLKKKLNFEELVAENRKQILADRLIMEQIEQSMDQRMEQSIKKVQDQ